MKLGSHTCSNSHDDSLMADCTHSPNFLSSSCLLSCTSSPAVDHLPDKETRKRKPKKTFEIDFGDDVNFDTYFRTTRVRKRFVHFSTCGLSRWLPAAHPLLSNESCYICRRADWLAENVKITHVCMRNKHHRQPSAYQTTGCSWLHANSTL